MSSPKFRQKRVGYLAAVQSFRIDTDVLMLTTNLMKKACYYPAVPGPRIPGLIMHLDTGSHIWIGTRNVVSDQRSRPHCLAVVGTGSVPRFGFKAVAQLAAYPKEGSFGVVQVFSPVSRVTADLLATITGVLER